MISRGIAKKIKGREFYHLIYDAESEVEKSSLVKLTTTCCFVKLHFVTSCNSRVFFDFFFVRL